MDRLASDQCALADRSNAGFIAESRRTATQRRNIVSASLAAGLVVALGLAGLAYWQRSVATEQRRIADEQRATALKNEDLAKHNEATAQTSQSLFLADLARQQRTLGDAGTALLLALEGLPDDTAGIARRYVPEAELQLNLAWFDLCERLILFGHEDAVLSAAFSPDGKRIVTASCDKTARLWDAETGKQIGAPLVGHKGYVTSAAFSPDGKRIVTASCDKTARLWDAATGKANRRTLVGP